MIEWAIIWKYSQLFTLIWTWVMIFESKVLDVSPNGGLSNWIVISFLDQIMIVTHYFVGNWISYHLKVSATVYLDLNLSYDFWKKGSWRLT